MTIYTIVGYWLDSMERFSTYVESNCPDEAEETCIREHPGLAVCGVLLGTQECVDTTPEVRFATV
jgi:hypothetical protein